MSAAMLGIPVASLSDAETASDVGAVLLTGAGGAFVLAATKGMAEAGGEGGDSALQYDARVHLQRRDQRDTAGKLYELPKPTIAVLPGPAVVPVCRYVVRFDTRHLMQL